MADSEANVRTKTSKKLKKRKQRIHEETERLSKVQRTEWNTVKHDMNSEQSESYCDDFKFDPPWKNLQLILCIQDKQLDLQRFVSFLFFIPSCHCLHSTKNTEQVLRHLFSVMRLGKRSILHLSQYEKIRLAFSFVQSRVEESDGTDLDCETIKLPRLLYFLNDWIQSVLISSDKKNMSDGKKSQVEGIEAYMDLRSWKIFKFCLQESLKFHVSLNMSRNLLRPLHFIAKNALSLLEESPIYSEESFLSGERYMLYDTALDCVSLVFSSHGGLSNENLELWVSTACVLLDLVQKMYTKHLDGSNIGVFALRFLCLVLQPFSKFLRVHPARKNGFHDFVDKLLEPLLDLLGNLHLQVNGSNSIWTERLLKMVEEVLSHGLFHPVHIDGFLSLHGSDMYNVSCDDKSKDSKAVIKSYHRHLFDVLNKIIARKNAMAIGSLGFLFSLFVNAARKSKETSMLSEGTRKMENTRDLRQLESEEDSSNNISSDTRKSLINFFIHIMEPLLHELDEYLQATMDAKLLLLDLHGLLKSISYLLASFMQEKVYERTEDMSGGACLNFLKKIYNALMSCSATLLSFSNCDVSDKMEMVMFTLSANEMLVAIGHLLEIEYKVIGEDLVKLWLTMLSYLAISWTLKDVLDQCSLSSSIAGLGCQIIDLYSQLRQVENAILALCKAIRLTVCHEGNTEERPRFLTSLSNEVYSESLEMLLSSQEFVNAIRKAAQSIPEGKVNGCIRHLTNDISESLKWTKDCSSLVDGEKFNKRSVKCTIQVSNLQVELLGRWLSRLYALVLASLTITEGNSNLIGVAIKELIALMRPYLSTLVGQQPDAIHSFLSYVMGNAVDWVAGKRKVLKKFGRSCQWVIVFFFQLFVSCRSLHRQAISLMPPALSKKMCAEAGDFIAYSAHELMERIGGIDTGYFSWIVQPSASLLVVMQFISDIYLKDGSADSCPLIYVFHSMALQRLVDLNRLLLLFKYLQNSQYNLQIKALEEEAVGLTNFMMESLSCVYQSPVLLSDVEVNCENIIAQDPHESKGWDLGVCFAYKKSLPTDIWSNLCKNIDVWGNHASKKHLKKFFKHLLHTSLHCVTSTFQNLSVHEIDECKRFKGVTLPQISSELLSNSVLYEQKFTCRNLASRICFALEKSVLPLFSKIAYSDINLQRSLNWHEFLNDLDNSAIVDRNKDFSVDCSTVDLSAQSREKLHTKVSREEKAFPLISKSFAICHHLLNFLCWIPDIKARSFSLYVTCIFNLERLLVSALLHFVNTVSQDHYYEFLRLFVSCRKALRYIIMGFCEKTEVDESLPNSIISESSFPVLWLYKSASLIVGHKEAFSAKNTTLLKLLVFSLMDHTSYVLKGMGKYQIIHRPTLDKEAVKPSEEVSNDRIVHEDSHLLQSSQYVDFQEFEALKSLTFMTDNLKEQMQNLLVHLKDAQCCGNVGFGMSYENVNRFSFAVSCLSGFLWSLASVVDLKEVKDCDCKGEVLLWNDNHTSQLNNCINVLGKVIDLFVQKLFVGNNQPFKSLCSLDTKWLTLEFSCTKADASFGTQQESEGAITCSASPAIGNNTEGSSDLEKLLEPRCENSVASVLGRADSFEPEYLNKPLLQSLLKGENLEVAFSLRQLLMASSVLLKLNLQKDSCSLLSSFVPTFIEISRVLLLEFTEMAEVPQQSAFLLLDGVMTYLRELSSYFLLTDPISSRKIYNNLIELYLRAMGKTISLQGKRAILTFHERQSSTKNFHERSFEAHSSSELYCFSLDEFKARLRMSFKAYIEKPSELHLLSAIQAVERALVGVREGCTMIYDIKASTDWGEISSVVAAGIDCFDMILEFVSGRKGLKLIKRHFQSSVAAIFNIILHLQSSQIFYGDLKSSTVANDPDPGSTILMCVEVLTTVSRKHAIFQMNSWHVGHLLRIPAALFQSFLQLRVSKGSSPSGSLIISEEQISHQVEAVDICYVDHQFSLNLFVACCQLLCTTIKRHQSECKQCVAHLEASVSVLLNCLETIDNKNFFSWEVEEGVKCACFLRRVYEEIKQQKDIFSRQCSLFLSNYIWVYSGYGPKRSGIRREIDEALRPGVYALIDACSPDDLQYLHTVFGEGPCRSTLANLQNDYKLNFKYEGKV
ncbi:Urb2/Npa2 family protein [Senna tora]|uniref:Urb2/Npa2 family protein n=1 Tax=Senna tora TaxID=362788 RepID=A0A834SWD5_9FABA|nr:Urb2/Npa2 family protein [Senna tora]